MTGYKWENFPSLGFKRYTQLILGISPPLARKTATAYPALDETEDEDPRRILELDLDPSSNDWAASGSGHGRPAG